MPSLLMVFLSLPFNYLPIDNEVGNFAVPVTGVAVTVAAAAYN